MYFSPALCYDFLYQTKEKKSYICMGREKNLLMKIKEGLRKWFLPTQSPLQNVLRTGIYRYRHLPFAEKYAHQHPQQAY